MLAGGLGLVLYILAALVVPEATEPSEPSTTSVQQKAGIGAMLVSGTVTNSA